MRIQMELEMRAARLQMCKCTEVKYLYAMQARVQMQ